MAISKYSTADAFDSTDWCSKAYSSGCITWYREDELDCQVSLNSGFTYCNNCIIYFHISSCIFIKRQSRIFCFICRVDNVGLSFLSAHSKNYTLYVIQSNLPVGSVCFHYSLKSIIFVEPQPKIR